MLRASHMVEIMGHCSHAETDWMCSQSLSYWIILQSIRQTDSDYHFTEVGGEREPGWGRETKIPCVMSFNFVLILVSRLSPRHQKEGAPRVNRDSDIRYSIPAPNSWFVINVFLCQVARHSHRWRNLYYDSRRCFTTLSKSKLTDRVSIGRHASAHSLSVKPESLYDR